MILPTTAIDRSVGATCTKQENSYFRRFLSVVWRTQGPIQQLKDSDDKCARCAHQQSNKMPPAMSERRSSRRPLRFVHRSANSKAFRSMLLPYVDGTQKGDCCRRLPFDKDSRA